MPYIAESHRQYLEDGGSPKSVGELNYIISTAVAMWMITNGLSYATINGAMGAMESAKQEFYRRVAVPYEDKKIAENGDIYPRELLS
jgi:hypothetical protein